MLAASYSILGMEIQSFNTVTYPKNIPLGSPPCVART